MEEQSLEEMMSSLSEANITVTQSTGEPLIIDMSDKVIDSPVSIVSQSIIDETKPEVQEMINNDENSFFNQHITKDMDELEKEFVVMQRQAAILDARMIKYKEKYKEVFDGLAKLEAAKAEVLKHEDDYKEVITSKLGSMGESKWKGMEVAFTYVKPSFKTTFNKARFEKEQPKLYAQYMDQTPVKAYIRTKLSLLPLLPEDIKEGDV